MVMRTVKRRLGRGESGVALIAAMLAIFILTVVVAALALATMGESGLSFDHARGAQALTLAEAGAYRALGELRFRISVLLDANVRNANEPDVRNPCRADGGRGEGWKIIKEFGGDNPEWVIENTKKRVTLGLGSSAVPIQVRDAANNPLGSFYATIYVRQANNTGSGDSANFCQFPPQNAVERYRINFDYFIVSTGRTARGTAQRTICLKNPGNNANCEAWVNAGNAGDSSWDSNGGWPILIEKASYARWALMLLETSNTWLFKTSNFDGPVHTNRRWLIWGCGNPPPPGCVGPKFQSDATQVEDTVGFGNCGNNPSPRPLPAGENPPCDVPSYQAGNPMRGGWLPPAQRPRTIDPPRTNRNSPFWAALGQPLREGGPPNNREIRERTTQLDNCPPDCTPVPAGIYFMDECGAAQCGGIFVKGSGPGSPALLNMVLTVEGGRQVIYVRHVNGLSGRFIILGATTPWECFTSCTGSFTSRVFTKGFNDSGGGGIIYVEGDITSSVDPQSGLYGIVQKNQRLTVAADGEIRITDHLVYEQPPNSAGDPVPNILGLYAWCSDGGCSQRDVTVVGADTPNNLFIDAAVLAPWGRFWVEGWDSLPDKGAMRLLGGVAQKHFGAWGGFNPALDPPETGYDRLMAYDQRFKTNNAPPFFPLADVYVAPRWPRFPFDILYDRPLWGENTRP